MYFLQKIFIFFFISYGISRLFNVKHNNMKNEIVKLFKPKEESIKFQVDIAKGKKKRKGLTKIIHDTKQVLKLIGKEAEFPLVCFGSFSLGTIAMLVCILMKNFFLMVPLILIAIAAPFVYIRNRSIKLQKMINEELETALSIITNSYIRNENILIAIEENINYIHQPIQALFKAFIFHCDYVNSDIKQNLRKLRLSLNNAVFMEWCNALISCQTDSSMRYTLTAIVKKLSYIRIVGVKLDSVLYEPVREFAFMVIILLFNIPVFYVLNRQWYIILTKSEYGHFILAVVVGIVAFCFANVLRLTRPIEYKR